MMKSISRLCIAIGLGLGLGVSVAHAQTEFDVPGTNGPYRLPTISQKAARFAATVHQQFDFSCGSAAVATLLSYHYGQPTSEYTAFDEMFAAGNQAKIRVEGFSLLDIKGFLAKRGFSADGFELPLEKLAEARIPAIVLITENGYHHFVVVKGLRDGRVLIGDSVSGTRALPRKRFEALWQSKLLFVIHNQQDLATFNDAGEWSRVPRAPLTAGVARNGLDALVMPRRGPNEL